MLYTMVPGLFSRRCQLLFFFTFSQWQFMNLSFAFHAASFSSKHSIGQIFNYCQQTKVLLSASKIPDHGDGGERTKPSTTIESDDPAKDDVSSFPSSSSVLFRDAGMSNGKDLEELGGKESRGDSGDNNNGSTEIIFGPSTSSSRMKKEKSSETSFSSIMSLGSFLLQRKAIEEDEIEKLKSREGKEKMQQISNVDKESDETNRVKAVGPLNPTDVQREFDEALQKFASDAETTIASFIDTYNQGAVGEDKKLKGKKMTDKVKKQPKKLTIPKSKDEQKEEENRIDPELIRELDASISILTGSGSEIGRREILKDIEMLRDVTSTSSSMRQRRGGEVQDVDNKVTNLLPLSDPRHTARIEIDMRRLAVNIASNIESIDQWKSFCEDGGGILPLLECIRDGAREVREGQLLTQGNDYDGLGMLGLVEQREAAFEAACKACKALRDLCVISKPFSAVITDSILRADVMWANAVDVESKTEKKQLFKGGILFDLAFLIKYSMDSDKLYNPRSEWEGMPSLRSNGINIISNRKQRKLARQRCALYVIQLLLAMSFASDKAVDRLRATMGLTDTVLACSSYAKKERLIRRWIRYPIELIKRKVRSEESNEEISEDPFLTAASVATGLSGQIKGTSNQLLAALGYNVWYPKTAGQKGLRILCLDGGGTRGITAISSMRSIVEAIGGVEVCDTFDMIAGTSTGAIIAFLVGLRRESSTMARKRYDKLIKRIFIKSALSTPMLLFTTATYDESPFNKVMMSILNDNSMLASRADPRVPLVFAISSKMSSTPTQLCLFRNYNYNGGEMNDAFVEDPIEAKEELSLPLDDDIFQLSGKTYYDYDLKLQANKPTQGSRHPGSFRVLQRAALRATTAAPTVFKPVLMGGELYCDGGIVASNPTAVAIHEARTIFPNVPIELVVSCGTGAFVEEKSEPRIGWDGIIGQIVNSATDGEQTHHVLEDILGQGSTAHLGRSSVSKTKYYRFNPIIGTADMFPIDGTDPEKLEELSKITTAYMNEPEQRTKLDEIVSILNGKRRKKRALFW